MSRFFMVHCVHVTHVWDTSCNYVYTCVPVSHNVVYRKHVPMWDRYTRVNFV